MQGNDVAMKQALDEYMKILVNFVVLFFEGLIFPRSYTMSPHACADGTNALSPKLNPLMVQFVVTQIFPLHHLDSAGINAESLQQMIDNTSVSIHNDLAKQLKTINKSFDCAKDKTNIDVQVVSTLAQVKANLAFLLSQQSFAQATKDSYLNFLKTLNKSNEIIFSDLKALTNSNYKPIVRSLVWLLTAYCDWYGVEIVEIADVQAAARLILPFEEISHKVIDFMLNTKPSNNLLHSPQKIKVMYEEIYTLLVKNNLFITEAALRRLVYFILNLMSQPLILTKAIQGMEYITNIYNLL